MEKNKKERQKVIYFMNKKQQEAQAIKNIIGHVCYSANSQV